MRPRLALALAIPGLAVAAGLGLASRSTLGEGFARPSETASELARGRAPSLEAAPVPVDRLASRRAVEPTPREAEPLDRSSFVAARVRELAARLGPPDDVAALRVAWPGFVRSLAADLEAGDVPELTRRAQDRALAPDLRLAALALRAQLAPDEALDPETLALLRGVREDPEAPQARVAVAERLLAAGGDARDLEGLLGRLESARGPERQGAVWVLQGAPAQRVGPALAERMSSAIEADTVVLAAIVLERVLTEPVSEALSRELGGILTERLEDAELEANARGHLALAASRLPGAEVTRCLVERLADPDTPAELRPWVAAALVGRDLGDAADGLGHVLDSPVHGDEARLDAARLLARQDDPAWSAHASEHLEQVARGVGDGRLRLAAVRALAALRDMPQDRRQLLEYLARHDADAGVRQAAGSALAWLE